MESISPLMGFVSAIAPTFLASLAGKIITDGIIIAETFFLTKKTVSKRRMFLGVFIISVVHVLPLFIISFFFPDGTAQNEIAYCLFICPIPFVLFIYYPIYRFIFKASRAMTILSLEWLLMCQYLVMLLFALFSSLWAGLPYGKLYDSLNIVLDLPEIVCTSAVALLSYIGLRKAVVRTKHFLDIPANYSVRVFKSLISIFLSTIGTYALLVCVRFLFLRQYRTDFRWFYVIIYLLLFIYQMYMLISQHYKNIRAIVQWQEKETELYINSLLQATSEFRQIKHDFYNILQTYGGYISNSDMDGLNRYHQSLSRTTVDAGRKLEMIEALRHRMPVYTLFTIKIQDANELGVRMDIGRINPLNQIEMNDLDLCRILSNLIDNAIQGAADSEQKLVIINSQLTGNTVTVVLSNSANENVETEHIFNMGYTTKPDHSGQGLSSVKRIIDTHNNCSIHIALQNRLFIAQLSLPAQ